MKRFLKTLLKKVLPYHWLDEFYLPLDKRRILRNHALKYIPFVTFRKGGKIAYGEWSYVIGLFQSIIYNQLPSENNSRILDVGCGYGLLGISAYSYIQKGGKYIGIDVDANAIDHCRKTFPSDMYAFSHLKANNPTYAPGHTEKRLPWPVEDESVGLVTALSVWTHFAEEDASFYLKEVQRVLKKGGRAIITFFILDEQYKKRQSGSRSSTSQFFSTDPNKWVFDQPVYQSKICFTTSWARQPEDAIAFEEKALFDLLISAKLDLKEILKGTWRESAGLYFQDVVILER